MTYKNWTKYYESAIKQNKNNKEKNDKLFEGLNDREKKTAELLLKQYQKSEKAVAETENRLNKINKDTELENRKNEVKRVVANALVKENNVSEGNNQVNGELLEQKKIDDAAKSEANTNIKEKQLKEDEEINSLNKKIQESAAETSEKIIKIEQDYEQKKENAYKSVKNQIENILNNNKLGENTYNDSAKKALLAIINDNKEVLEEKADELYDYVNNLDFQSGSSGNNEFSLVELYANNEKIFLTKKAMDLASSIKFDSFNRFGIIYGDFLELEYDNKTYTARAGALATQEEKNVVEAICDYKRIKPTIGTCIYYKDRIYVFSGDGYWRVAQEIISANNKKELQALIGTVNKELNGENEEE